ncbi:MAG: murein biosynthesis integral membrane protein MurJ [Actinomycetota bacterium]|nr:murein biosynthesis integral membrane protein MurJ [Actinomycetota bacterium]
MGIAGIGRRVRALRPSQKGSASAVARGIFLSRLTGLARERALGHFFGTGYAADAFTAASRIPNLLQNLLGEGVLSASMIPVYSRLLAEGREKEAGRVAGALAGLLAAVVGILVVLAILFARPLTAVLAPGLAEQTFELTVTLLRIVTPGVGFLVMSAWCLAVLNSHRRFFLSYVAPTLMNVAQIAVLVGAAAVLAGVNLEGELNPSAQSLLVLWLGWGTVVGGVLQFVVQIPAVWRIAPGVRLSLRTDLAGTRETVRSFVPIVAGRGVVHLTGYLQLLLASFLALGALAALRYAQMLYVLPVSLFGMAVAAAELPELSVIDPGRRIELRDRIEKGLARIAFFVVPTMVAYVLIGDLIVAAVYESGEFDGRDVLQVWLVLAVHALALLAATGSRLLQSVLYGLGEPRTPARIAVVRVAVSLVLGVVLMFQLDRVVVGAGGLNVVGDLPAVTPLPEEFRDPALAEGRHHLGAIGLSAAAAVAAWVEYRLLRQAVRRWVGRVRIGGGRIRSILVASAVGGVVGIGTRPITSDWMPVVAAIVSVGAMGAAYLIGARLLGVPESRQLLRLPRLPPSRDE